VSQEKRFTILESERLQLRYQQAADVEALVDLWSDPEVTRYLGGPRDRAWLQSVFTVAAGRCTTIWGTSTIEHLAPTAPTVAHSVRAR
jgi:RimJ/RimL family protein N-acetyltransferase